MVTTKEQLKTYILEELGSPQLNVELTDNQIYHNIEKAVQKFTNFAYDGELTKFIKFNCQGRGDYHVDPSVEEIIRVEETSVFSVFDLQGFYVDQNLVNFIMTNNSVAVSYLCTLSATRSLLEKFFKHQVAYEFNSLKGILNIFEDFYGPLLIECRCRYIPDENDKVYDQEWVKAMSVELCRLTQSVVLGKYSQNLVGGSQVNWSEIRSLAQENIQRLEEELKERWVEPAPFLIL